MENRGAPTERRPHEPVAMVREGAIGSIASLEAAGMHREEGAGKVDLSRTGGSISRDGVAAVMMACLGQDRTVRKCVGLVEGSSPNAETLSDPGRRFPPMRGRHGSCFNQETGPLHEALETQLGKE